VPTSLNRVTWAAVATGLVVIGISAFTLPYGTTHKAFIGMVGASIIAALTLALWVAAQHFPSRPLLRRMLPLALAASAVTCGLVAGSPGLGTYVVLAAMATSAAAYDFGLVTACIVTATGIIAVDIVGLVCRVGAWGLLGGLLGVPLLMILGLLFGRLLLGYHVQAEQSALLLANAEKLRTEQSRVAAVDERNRIAREIHDVLAHSLGSLAVQIQAARAVLTDQGDVQRAVDLLTRAQRSAAEGLVDTRRALQALRSDTPPLADVLDELGAEYRHQYHTPVTVEVTGQPRPLTPDASVALTRAAQESLVNAAKHAPYQPVVVRLDFTDGPTKLTILNRLTNGRSVQPRLETANGGYGLAGMRERLRLIGGSLEAHATDGKWVVAAQVPQ